MTDDHESYVTVYESMGGWKAVLLWWNPELGGFWEPMQTGICGFNERADAVIDAKIWATEEGLEFKEK